MRRNIARDRIKRSIRMYVCTTCDINHDLTPNNPPHGTHRPFCLVTNRNVILAEHIADFDLELISSTRT